MRVFAMMVFLAGGAFAQGVMPARDSELWKYKLPGNAFYYIEERPSVYTNSAVYRSFTNHCPPFASRRLPPSAWMKDMTRESVERFKAWRRKDQWVMSPYFRSVGKAPVTEAAAKTWNPRTWIEDYMSLNGGILWPSQVGSTNSAARSVEDVVAGIYRRLDFEVGEAELVAPWATNLTKEVVTDAREYESVERCTGSGWRILSPYVSQALERLYDDEGGSWVAYLGSSAQVPVVPVVMARWRGTATATFRLEESEGKWSVEAEPEYKSEYSVETNMIPIVGEVSIELEGIYDGDQTVPLYGLAVVGFPVDTSSTNLARIGTEATINGMDCWRVECDDILGVESAPEGEIETWYEASWILEIGAPSGRLVKAVGKHWEASLPQWGSTAFYFTFPPAMSSAYVPRRVTTRWGDEDTDTSFRSFRDVMRWDDIGPAEWQDIIGTSVFRSEIPDEAFASRRHTPVCTGATGEAEPIWDNIGAVHFYSRTEPPVHLGYRINGKSYAAGEFERDNLGDVLHTTTVLGLWVSTMEVGLARREGECVEYSGSVDVSSDIFVVHELGDR